MSIQAMTWVLESADIPAGPDAPTLTLVLLGLANHADREGRGAFPSKQTLAEYSRVTESTVRRALRKLEALELIVSGDQQLMSHIRPDRRPVVYDLSVQRGRSLHPRKDDGGAASDERGRSGEVTGAQPGPYGGAPVHPEPSLTVPESFAEPASTASAGQISAFDVPAAPEKTARRKPQLPLSDNWHPNEGHRQYARSHELDLTHQVMKFRAHAAANDRRQRDWNATFATWLMNAAEWASSGSVRATRSSNGRRIPNHPHGYVED